jgi:hypothetical protein
MPLQFAFRRENFSALAVGLVEVERRVRLAIFLQGAIDCFERIVEIMWPACLVE